MAKSLINLGTAPNDRTGDTLRDAGSKMNSNVNELYTALGNGTTLQVAVSGATNGQVLKFNGTSFVPASDLNTDAVISVNTQTGAVVLDTDDVAEGTTNQYYTDARARAAISASGALSYDNTTGALTFTQGNTDTVAEGTSNLYFTSGRFDFRLSQKSTDDLAEGSTNLYFTTSRASSAARNAISVIGSTTYDATTGTITSPTISTAGLSGDYNDLSNRPTKFSAYAVDAGNAPTTSAGKAGDVPGLVAYDSNYIYVCTGTYFPPASYDSLLLANYTNVNVFAIPNTEIQPLVGGKFQIDPTGTPAGSIRNITNVTDTGTEWEITVDGAPQSATFGTTVRVFEPSPPIWKRAAISTW